MNGESVFTFEDAKTVVDFCGPNDSNLVLIEELFGAPIKTKGNELIFPEGDSQLRSNLKLLLGELQSYYREGRSIDPDLIRSLYEHLEDGRSGEGLRNNNITIPNGFSKVFPRSYNQAVFLKALNEYDMCFSIGPAGTGKTFLAIAHALSEVLSRKKRKLLLTRPVVEAGESLGFLPGDMAQKLNPYLKPLYDAMDTLIPTEVVNRLEESRVIEIAPLAYMRGRSLKDCYIILDEAQNASREQMKMFLTRLGEGSKAVITGDVTQIDLPRKQNSGLIHAARILKSIPEVHFSYFSNRDVVRSQLVRKIIKAYDDYYKAEGEPGA